LIAIAIAAALHEDVAYNQLHLRMKTLHRVNVVAAVDDDGVTVGVDETQNLENPQQGHHVLGGDEHDLHFLHRVVDSPSYFFEILRIT